MKVYIDLVVVVNYLFDLILLMSVNFILKRNISLKRMMLSSLIGEGTIILLFVSLNRWLLMIIKVIWAMVICGVCFGYQDFNYFKKNLFYFYMVSMLLGGSVYFLKEQFDGCYLMVLGIGIFLFYKYISSFHLLKNNYSNYYNGKLYFDSEHYILVHAYMDTGNKLIDPYSKKGIILVEKEKIMEYLPDKYLYVPYHSLNNKGLLSCFKGFCLEIEGRRLFQFLIGVSQEKFYMDGIDCVISSKIMEGLK